MDSRWDIVPQGQRGRVSALVALLAVSAIVSTAANAQTSPSRMRPNSSVRSVRMEQAAQLRLAQAAETAVPMPMDLPAPERSQHSQFGSPAAGEPSLDNADSEPSGDSEVMSPRQFRVPLQGPDFRNMQIKAEDGLLSLMVRDAPLRDVITLLAETHGLNVVTADPLTQPISVTLDRVELNDALDAILSIAGYSFAVQRNIILISSLNNATLSLTPQAQGLRLEVFQLDYATAQDVNTAVTGMLSPLGHSFVISSSSTDNRRPREIVAVNDLPQFLDRIRQYIAQVDIPPRQVMIEAHVLQVDLDDQDRHGVNLDQLFRREGNVLLEMHTSGFGGSPAQAFTFRFSDGNLTAFLEMLRTQTDAKTLASPRLLVLNGQQARLQVGQQLGFRVTTTTETSTTESVDFLDVGVVLEVTPRISRDGKIMMEVRPEVSSGQVSATTGLPEEKTTELETDILLCDHEGIVLGGLIQEVDSDVQSKLPVLGDLYVVGRLFQRRETIKQRREIIITLIPRLIPYESDYVLQAHEQFARTETRLLDGPLQRVHRPWEARLPDAIDNPHVLHGPRLGPDARLWHCGQCGQTNQAAECGQCGAGFEAAATVSSSGQRPAPANEMPRPAIQLPSRQSSPSAPYAPPAPPLPGTDGSEPNSSRSSRRDPFPVTPSASLETAATGRITGMTVRSASRRLPALAPPSHPSQRVESYDGRMLR